MKLQFSSDEAKVLDYKNSIDEIATARDQYLDLINEYSEALTTLGYLEKVDSKLVLEPSIFRLIKEEEFRKKGNSSDEFIT